MKFTHCSWALKRAISNFKKNIIWLRIQDLLNTSSRLKPTSRMEIRPSSSTLENSNSFTLSFSRIDIFFNSYFYTKYILNKVEREKTFWAVFSRHFWWNRKMHFFQQQKKIEASLFIDWLRNHHYSFQILLNPKIFTQAKKNVINVDLQVILLFCFAEKKSKAWFFCAQVSSSLVIIKL